ncbi:hypothetical protein ACQEU3_43665 [Spirillospora sp. CA-253888]
MPGLSRTTYQYDRRQGLPSWALLAEDGRSCRWYASLTEPGHPVHHFSWDLWLDEPDQLPRGTLHTTPSLAQWLRQVLDDHHTDWINDPPF